MELRAQEVHEKQFHDAWRGYNQEEVDDFLDEVAEALEATTRENEELRARIVELDQAVAASRNTEDMLKKTLVTAQRAAEEAIATAKTKAEQILEEAEARAKKAAQDAQQRTAQAEREYGAKKREMEESIERLRNFEAELKQRLRNYLEQQQRSLESLEGKPAPARAAQQQPRPQHGRPPQGQAPASDTPGEATEQRPRSFSWRAERSQ
jgi:cell division initiation protein